jgi:hypothetical protein
VNFQGRQAVLWWNQAHRPSVQVSGAGRKDPPVRRKNRRAASRSVRRRDLGSKHCSASHTAKATLQPAGLRFLAEARIAIASLNPVSANAAGKLFSHGLQLHEDASVRVHPRLHVGRGRRRSPSMLTSMSNIQVGSPGLITYIKPERATHKTPKRVPCRLFGPKGRRHLISITHCAPRYCLCASTPVRPCQ